MADAAARGSLRRRHLALAGAAICAATGCAALAGWYLGIPILTRLDARFNPMAPSTALLLLLLGGALGAHLLAPGRRWALRLRIATAYCGAGASTLLLILSAQKVYLDFEHPGLAILPNGGGFPFGHMSPATALGCLLAGLSLLKGGDEAPAEAAATPWPLLPAAMLAAASGILLVASLFGAPVLYSGDFIPPAPMTVAALFSLAIALVCVTWPRRRGDPQPVRVGQREAALLILAFLVLAAGIVAAGLFSYLPYERHYRDEIEHQLTAVANLKSDELARWRGERLADAHGFFTNPAFAALVRRGLAPPGDAEALRLLKGWIAAHQHDENYSRISLLDAGGVERLTAPETPAEPDFAAGHDLEKLLRAREIVFLDFHRHQPGGAIRLGLVVPIFERLGAPRPLGILVLSMNPATQLYPSLAHWPTPSRSAETLLVRREGDQVVFLDEPRFAKDAALSLRLPLLRTQTPAVAAVLGHRGVMEGDDDRGVRVLADTRAIPGSPWFLVTRIDLAEVYAPLRDRLWLTVAMVAALLLGAGGGIGLLWRQRTLGIYRERLADEREQSWLRTVIARSLNEIYVFDAATLRFTFANEGACRNLGYPLDELLALTPLDIKPRIAAAALAEMVRPLRDGTVPVLTFETVHLRKDGSEYPVEVHLQLVDSGRGEVFLAVINDITERTRAEARLRLNEARLEGLLEISEQGDRSEAQLLDFALHKALALTGSAVGYVYLYHEGTRQFVLNSWSRGVMEECAVVEKQTVYDLDKTGIWGEAVRQRQPIVVNDFAAAHPLKKGYPDGHVPLRNFLTLPIFSGFEIVAVVGVGNKPEDYDASDIVQLSLLMDSVWRIVERSRAEAALDARNALLGAVFNSPDDVIIFSVDRAYRYTAFNEKHRALMRLIWNAEIETGLCILDMMTDRVLREAARASFDRALAGAAFTEVQHQPEPGLWFEFSWNPIRAQGGEVTGVAAFIRDITGRKRAEEALRESEARFRTLFESMSEGVALHEIVRDGSGAAVDYRLLDVNAAFEKQTGIPSARARGALASVLYGGNPPFLDEYARVADGGDPLGFEIFHAPMNRHFSISVVSPKAGQFATVFEDITGRKLREEELRLKTTELERFIYTVSHDLRSPLVTIKTFLGYLEEDLSRAAQERIDKDLRFMRTATDRMGGLLDDLLEMSRVGRLVAQPVDTSLADLVAEASALVAGRIAERGVGLRVDPVEIALRGDRARLVEIWQNLLENAVKFMGGQAAPLISVGAERRGEDVVFFVRDNGGGFDPRYREKIFGLFERLDPAVEGTGLGLALVKRIVELYGGTIAADSDGPGRGACISFTLPGALAAPGAGAGG